MPTFAQIKSMPIGYRIAPQFQQMEVPIISTWDFYDGPLSGILLLENKRCWFECVESNPDGDLLGWYRRYAIVELTDDQLLVIDCDNLTNSPIDISDNQVLGWFET
jgi:hypothetical protein